MDLAINKVFKDNLKIIFEENWLFFEKIENKIKLQTERLNLIDYIHQICYNDSIINNTITKRGFNHVCIINKFYISDEKEKIRQGYIYDLLFNEKNEIINSIISKNDERK